MSFKTPRTALSWNQDYKSTVSDLRIRLKDINGQDPSNLEMFMLCMSLAFDQGVKGDLPPRKSDSVRLSYLKAEHEAFIRALALHEANDSNILLDDDKVLDVAESYASAGLVILHQALNDAQNFRGFITAKLYQASVNAVASEAT